jgi:uncharacterized protein YndB with AHSA1/START domain
MNSITVSTITKLSIQDAWKAWTNPEHVIHWTFASDDWHSPKASSQLHEGGRFLTRMEAKDGSEGFDFEGTFTLVSAPDKLEYKLDDDRMVSVVFEEVPDGTRITETFDPENINSLELQRAGWQAILENYKKHADGLSA